ncbi:MULTISPECIES: peptidoglycan DD-metalloendopeptidase family protein [Pseudoalteromonas]|uniref:Peptidoglycan-binding protein n=1 Tax=Pseudoalteromonas amylolytica TaxID=1859457 RepID=A0A1S1MTE8_9GAMM|nr:MULTISPECIES: peptidoglycan DD-metalloendopeptidase family protein [Pseudoalteromonas]OHU88625.1 peptidoglycan-binding protein [Pseudoalteromonas sp. JW3]OHU90468.1 peptidoglycan-binding protein [Pseudoalteromonas amylolytica]
MLKTYLLILTTVCMLLAGCSSRHTPAPVTSLSSGKSSETQKIHIKNNQYQVQKGDTLFAIAFSANKDVRTIAQINGIKPPYVIYPGQTIYVENPQNKNKKRKKYTIKADKSSKKKQKNNKITKKELDQPKQREYVQKHSSKNDNESKVIFSNKVRWRWPAVGKVTKHFSSKENGYKGLQITNVEGAPVKAAADGIVVYAGSALRGYGNLIILKHNDDYLSAYAHNSKLEVTEQQKVKVGQKIAEMGSTDATKTALRFEIRFRGQAVNPVKYLPSK